MNLIEMEGFSEEKPRLFLSPLNPNAQGQEDKEPEEDGAAANFAPQQEAGRTRWIQSVNFDLILTPFIISHYNKQ